MSIKSFVTSFEVPDHGWNKKERYCQFLEQWGNCIVFAGFAGFAGFAVFQRFANVATLKDGVRPEACSIKLKKENDTTKKY